MQNTVRLALLQIGAIVAGILASGIGYHAVNELGGNVPVSTVFLVHFGFWLLALPVGWAFLTLRLCARADVSDAKKSAAFWSGVALVLGVAALGLYGAAAPWMQGDWPTRP